MNIASSNNYLKEAIAEMVDDFMGSPKSRLMNAGYKIIRGKMTPKERRIIKKVTGQFGVEVLKRLNHTIRPIKGKKK